MGLYTPGKSLEDRKQGRKKMKKVLSGVVAALILSVGTSASSMVEQSVSRLLRQQSLQCGEIIRHAVVLHTEKDISTLRKTRQILRNELEKMQNETVCLQKDERLKMHDDYLLSIREGLEHMERLIEEPMNKANLEQMRNVCAFISVVDQEMLENLSEKPKKSYQASR